MINFAALVPHPPAMIPEISDDRITKYNQTTKSLEKLGQTLAEKDPRTIIIITPHGPFHPEKINIGGTPKFKGDLFDFGANLEFEFNNDLKLARRIAKRAEEEGIPTTIYRPNNEFSRLDHGVIVPFYYLLEEIGSMNIIPITYSGIDRNYHFALGEIIEEIAKNLDYDIAIIASGDLSHKLVDKNSPGYKIGEEYDQMVIDYINDKDIRSFIKIDPKIIDQAGECAFYSLLILLGAISDYNYQPKIYSYQSPFGIGHLVASFNLKEKRFTSSREIN